VGTTAAAVNGSRRMPSETIQPGKLVSLTYRITDSNGQIIEQSDLPVSYLYAGETELIGGMDRAVAGRKAGESVELMVQPDAAFGPHDPGLTYTDALENVPPEFRRIGAEVPMQSESGEIKTFYVTRIENGRLTVDGNHPLAGKTLKIHVKVLEVRDPTADDLLRLQTSTPLAPSGH
jgi:FKBP-type peptidyl-prolyl cis-trans isomerase SlyD